MKFYYLHGFASGVKSKKALFFKDKLKEDLKLNLEIPDLNKPSFEKLKISSQIDYLKTLFEAEDDIFLIGSSLGAYLSILVQEELKERIRGMVLVAPAFEFLSRQLQLLPQEKLDDWKKSGYLNIHHHAYKAEMKLGYQIVDDALSFEKESYQVYCDTLVFHGINDESVPWSLSKKYLTGQKNVRLKFLQSDHQMLDSIETIYKISLEHISSIIDI